jgi:hypothetical protein
VPRGDGRAHLVDLRVHPRGRQSLRRRPEWSRTAAGDCAARRNVAPAAGPGAASAPGPAAATSASLPSRRARPSRHRRSGDDAPPPPAAPIPAAARRAGPTSSSSSCTSAAGGADRRRLVSPETANAGGLGRVRRGPRQAALGRGSDARRGDDADQLARVVPNQGQRRPVLSRRFQAGVNRLDSVFVDPAGQRRDPGGLPGGAGALRQLPLPQQRRVERGFGHLDTSTRRARLTQAASVRTGGAGDPRRPACSSRRTARGRAVRLLRASETVRPASTWGRGACWLCLSRWS